MILMQYQFGANLMKRIIKEVFVDIRQTCPGGTGGIEPGTLADARIVPIGSYVVLDRRVVGDISLGSTTAPITGSTYAPGSKWDPMPTYDPKMDLAPTAEWQLQQTCDKNPADCGRLIPLSLGNQPILLATLGVEMDVAEFAVLQVDRAPTVATSSAKITVGIQVLPRPRLRIGQVVYPTCSGESCGDVVMQLVWVSGVVTSPTGALAAITSFQDLSQMGFPAPIPAPTGVTGGFGPSGPPPSTTLANLVLLSGTGPLTGYTTPIPNTGFVGPVVNAGLAFSQALDRFCVLVEFMSSTFKGANNPTIIRRWNSFYQFDRPGAALTPADDRDWRAAQIARQDLTIPDATFRLFLSLESSKALFPLAVRAVLATLPDYIDIDVEYGITWSFPILAQNLVIEVKRVHGVPICPLFGKYKVSVAAPLRFELATTNTYVVVRPNEDISVDAAKEGLCVASDFVLAYLTGSVWVGFIAAIKATLLDFFTRQAKALDAIPTYEPLPVFLGSKVAPMMPAATGGWKTFAAQPTYVSLMGFQASDSSGDVLDGLMVQSRVFEDAGWPEIPPKLTVSVLKFHWIWNGPPCATADRKAKFIRDYKHLTTEAHVNPDGSNGVPAAALVGAGVYQLVANVLVMANPGICMFTIPAKYDGRGELRDPRGAIIDSWPSLYVDSRHTSSLTPKPTIKYFCDSFDYDALTSTGCTNPTMAGVLIDVVLDTSQIPLFDPASPGPFAHRSAGLLVTSKRGIALVDLGRVPPLDEKTILQLDAGAHMDCAAIDEWREKKSTYRPKEIPAKITPGDPPFIFGVSGADDVDPSVILRLVTGEAGSLPR